MKRIAFWIVVAGALGALGFALSQRITEVKRVRAEQAKPVVPEPPAVRVEPLAPHDFETRVVVAGEIKPLSVVRLTPRVPGRVLELKADVGDAVTAGQPLALLDEGEMGFQSKTAAAQVRAARAAAEQAKVGVDTARREVERSRRLAKAKAIPGAQLDQAESAYSMAKASLSAARAQVAVAQAGLDTAKGVLAWTQVESPIAGVITAKMADVGQMAAPTQPLYEIQDQSELRVHMRVPPEALRHLSTGAEVKFHTDAWPGRTFTGHIAVLSPTLDPQSRRAHAELKVDAGQEGLVPFMFVEVELLVDQRQAQLSAPREAVLTTSEGPVVFLARDGKAARVPVDLAQADDVRVPVGAPAQAGDSVIVAGRSMVTDGGDIRVVTTADAGKSKRADETAPEATP